MDHEVKVEKDVARRGPGVGVGPAMQAMARVLGRNDAAGRRVMAPQILLQDEE